MLELTGLQFGGVGAAAHVIRALLADGDAAKVDGARIGMSVAEWPKGMSRCCRCPPLRQQRRPNWPHQVWEDVPNGGIPKVFNQEVRGLALESEVDTSWQGSVLGRALTS